MVDYDMVHILPSKGGKRCPVALAPHLQMRRLGCIDILGNELDHRKEFLQCVINVVCQCCNLPGCHNATYVALVWGSSKDTGRFVVRSPVYCKVCQQFLKFLKFEELL